MTSGKIIGIGWAKTGTTTLGECFRTLGCQHVSGRLDLVDHLGDKNLDQVLGVLEEYESAEDWPWLLLYREIDTAFPNSKFILTIREPQSWLRSYRNMTERENSSTSLDRRRRVLYGFDPATAHDDVLVDRVARHNEAVRAYFRDRPTDLLEVDWTQGAGWHELCTFLDRPIPAADFPHANRGNYASPRRPARDALRRLRHSARNIMSR